MSLNFEREEFGLGTKKLREFMAKNELDVILLFRQESMFYLSDYKTLSYVYFQCLYLAMDVKLILVAWAAYYK